MRQMLLLLSSFSLALVEAEKTVAPPRGRTPMRSMSTGTPAGRRCRIAC